MVWNPTTANLSAHHSSCLPSCLTLTQCAVKPKKPFPITPAVHASAVIETQPGVAYSNHKLLLTGYTPSLSSQQCRPSILQFSPQTCYGCMSLPRELMAIPLVSFLVSFLQGSYEKPSYLQLQETQYQVSPHMTHQELRAYLVITDDKLRNCMKDPLVAELFWQYLFHHNVVQGELLLSLFLSLTNFFPDFPRNCVVVQRDVGFKTFFLVFLPLASKVVMYACIQSPEESLLLAMFCNETCILPVNICSK